MSLEFTGALLIIASVAVGAFILEKFAIDSDNYALWVVGVTGAIMLLVMTLMTIKPIYTEVTPVESEVVVIDKGRNAVVGGEKYRTNFTYVDKPVFVYKKYAFPWDVHNRELHLPMPKYNAE